MACRVLMVGLSTPELPQQDGVTVFSTSFEDAREKLLTGQFDRLITVVRLGRFNGLHLAILARHEFPRMRIVVFSESDDPVLRKEARAVGARYMVKPLERESCAQ